jgi:pimeloyl-ACP methyl ester carboxylesterase
MPLDPASGVFYKVQGQGQPLMIGLPLMASFTQLFGAEMQGVLDGYLNRLTDHYRVLRVDYPSIGGSRDIAPEALTADRVCADLLAVASAAGFDQFVYWGYSWGAAVGLQLAARTDRLSALVLGGWPPLQAPYADILRATQLKQADPEPSSMKVLRSKAQYRQWETYYRSMLHWPEAACPRCCTSALRVTWWKPASPSASRQSFASSVPPCSSKAGACMSSKAKAMACACNPIWSCRRCGLFWTRCHDSARD